MPSKTRKTSAKRPTAASEVQIYLRIPRSVRDGLKDLATADDRKMAAYIKRVLTQHVEQHKGE